MNGPDGLEYHSFEPIAQCYSTYGCHTAHFCGLLILALDVAAGPARDAAGLSTT